MAKDSTDPRTVLAENFGTAQTLGQTEVAKRNADMLDRLEKKDQHKK